MYSYKVCVFLLAAILVGGKCENEVDSVDSTISPRWLFDQSPRDSNEDIEASASESHPHTLKTGITVGLESEPHLQILELAETFLKLKGEIASKIYAVIVENSDLLHSVTNFAISKASHLHKFALSGIAILRKVLEFAIALFGKWALPSLTVALNKPVATVTETVYVQPQPVPFSGNVYNGQDAPQFADSYGNYRGY